MKILPYSETAVAEWRDFVQQHPDRSIGHLPEVAALERLAAGATNRSLILREDSGRLVGVVPLFEIERRELRVVRTRMLTSGTHLPSGPLLAPSLSLKQQAKITEQLVTRIVADAMRWGMHAISIAYPTVVKGKPAVESLGLYPLRPFGFQESHVVAMVADLTATDDVLLANLDAKCRNQIKRCRSGGAETRVLESRDEWMQAEVLNRSTLGRDAYSTEIMAAVWDLFVAPGHAAVVGTYYQGRLISVVTVTLVGGSSYYWFSFNETPLPLPGANSLALWEGMLTAKRAGAAMFELGSLEFDNPKQVRIGKFKAQFGGRPVYALTGVRQLTPIRADTIDLAGNVLRKALNRARRGSRESVGTEPASSADE